MEQGGRYNSLPPPDRLTKVEAKLDAHLDDYTDLKRLVTEMQQHLREMENWRLEVNVYFKQIRWLIILVAAALITGIINILLNLELHVQ